MKPRFPRYLVLLVALLLAGAALSVAGCGGPDETTTTLAASTTTLLAPTATTEGTVATAGTSAGTSGSVAVKGLADNPLILTVVELETMTVSEITVDHPKLGMTDYRGVRLSDLFATLEVQGGATTVVMTASDGYMAEIALADIQASTDAILAIGDDGKLSVVIPGMERKSWVKDVVSLEFE
jgi:hypothetical protein